MECVRVCLRLFLVLQVAYCFCLPDFVLTWSYDCNEEASLTCFHYGGRTGRFILCLDRWERI